MNDLDDILSNNEPAQPAPAEATVTQESEQAPKPEASISQRKQWANREEEAKQEGLGNVRDPATGKFVPREAKAEAPATPEKTDVKPETAAPPKQELTDKERAFLRAMEEERGKRQALERKLAEVEARVNPAQPPKEFLDDPDGWRKEVEARVASEVQNVRLSTAETIARSRYQDFDQKVQVFAQVMQANPAVYQEWMKSPDPAEYAYKTGKMALERIEWEQAGGAEGMKAKLEAEIRAKLEAEMKVKLDAAAAERARLPGSLSDVPGSASGRKAWTGPSSFDDILAPNQKH